MANEPEAGMLIVVGAHLKAEIADRPLAEDLRDQVLLWQRENGCLDDGLRPLICTDLWYLNVTDLMLQPTIALGDPEVNAATAYLANRLPTAMVVDGAARIHLDPEFIEPKACIWGGTVDGTSEGLDLFLRRYLNDFLRCAHDLPLGSRDRP